MGNKKILVVIAILVLLPVASINADNSGVASLEGQWTCIFAVHKGRIIPEDIGTIYNCDKNYFPREHIIRWSNSKSTTDDFVGYSLIPKQSPKAINLTIVEKTTEEGEKTVKKSTLFAKGIYRAKGDIVVFCFNAMDGEKAMQRPHQFSLKGTFLILKKVPPVRPEIKKKGEELKAEKK